MNTSLLQQIEKPRDAEARLLARVYALILSWSEPDASDVQTEPRELDEREAKARNNDDDEK